MAILVGIQLPDAAADNAPPGGAVVFADSLRPTSARPAGKMLNQTTVPESNARWVADKAILIGEQGATTSAPATAHVTIPDTAGKIRFTAEVTPKGSAFVGLALGRGNLSSNFWQSLSLMAVVWGNGQYNLYAAGKNLIDVPEKGVVQPDRPNRTELSLDTIPRTVTLRLNGKTVLENAKLPAEVPLDRITAAGIHFQEPVVAGQPVVSDLRVERASLSAAGLEPADYGQTLVVPNQEVTLRWRASDPGPKQEIPYFVRDYGGAVLGEGRATRQRDDTFTLTRRFPRGYAEVDFPESHQTFGMVSLERWTGPAEPFYGIDAALTWLEQDPARRAGLGVSRRCGRLSLKRCGGLATPRPLNPTRAGPSPCGNSCSNLPSGRLCSQHRPATDGDGGARQE